MDNLCQKKIGNILVYGTEGFISDVSWALSLVLSKDSLSWKRIQENLTEIVESQHTGVYCESGIFNLKNNRLLPIAWTASVLVHESWHVEYFLTGKTYEGEEAEKRILEKKGQPMDKNEIIDFTNVIHFLW